MNKYEAIKKVVDFIDKQTERIKNSSHLILNDYPRPQQVVELINELDDRGTKEATFFINSSICRIERNGTLDFLDKNENIPIEDFRKVREQPSTSKINVEWV